MTAPAPLPPPPEAPPRYDCRVLYGGWTSLGMTSEHRLRAFRRVVREVAVLSYDALLATRVPLMRRLSDRFQLSPQVAALNRALIAAAKRERPDLIWLDKPIYVYPATVARLRDAGFRVVTYNLDYPLGPRHDPVWRLLKPALPLYSAHVVPRQAQVPEYLALGVPQVVKVRLSFEPTVHFSAARLGLAANPDLDLSFIGFPHDERLRWIRAILARRPGLRFGLYGWGWEAHARQLRAQGLRCHGPVWDDQYRETLWRSRLSLAFVTRSNRDEMSHKAVEIAAAGTPLLVESSPEHHRIFPAGSALFFSDPDELPDLVAAALARDDLAAIGAAGEAAVHRARLSNDDVIRHCLAELGYQQQRGNADHG